MTVQVDTTNGLKLTQTGGNVVCGNGADKTCLNVCALPCPAPPRPAPPRPAPPRPAPPRPPACLPKHTCAHTHARKRTPACNHTQSHTQVHTPSLIH